MSEVDSNQWTQRHKDFDAGLDADQVECQAMLDGLANIDAGVADERISGAVDDQLVDAGNSWAERQAVLETLSGAVAEEIARRGEMMMESYPFHVRSGSLTYRRSETGVYEFCLAAARNPSGVAEGKPRASAVFEWIARDVMALHLGAGARGFRAGWPPYAIEGRGARAKDTFDALQQHCGEFCWNPEHIYPSDPEPKDLKDVGLDVVVWKPWPDGRLAQMFAVGQCACGKNDIDARKGRELSLRRLENWLRPLCYAAPVRCFLAAHHIPNQTELYDLSKEAGLVFDRARIAMLAEASPAAMKCAEGMDYHEFAKFYATQQAA